MESKMLPFNDRWATALFLLFGSCIRDDHTVIRDIHVQSTRCVSCGREVADWDIMNGLCTG